MDKGTVVTMSVDIDSINVGDVLTMTDGDLSDTGTVVSIDYDANMIAIEVPTSRGTSVMEVDPDEPGLEVAS
jgi:hypothetical protein